MIQSYDSPAIIRTLSPMESAVMGWLEAERRMAVTIDDVSETFPWDREAIRQVLFRLSRKGWLRRTARGRYETVLAETAGFAPPNPWAALASWIPAHYVAFQSAAYELGLTPDRPGDVQVAVAVGTKRPTAWAEVPIELAHLRTFSLDGTERRDLHGWEISVATPEKVLSDSALVPGRVGGVRGLARIATRAQDSLDWREAVRLIDTHPNGLAAMRRLAALLEVVETPVPEPLARRAAHPGQRVRRILLGDHEFDGSDGELLEPWNVVANIDAADLHEELRR
ncbi:MAG: type IV toxin-antitoxin system AbiEi family antitoxin domain-containing protein [Solirubrobacteraceae bacterium]